MIISVRTVLAAAVLAVMQFGTSCDAETIRVAAQKTGTLAWELAVIRSHGLDRKANLSIDVVELASPEAGKIALRSGSADVMVSDWPWVSRERSLGAKLQFYPYSSALGAVMVPAASPLKTLADGDPVRQVFRVQVLEPMETIQGDGELSDAPTLEMFSRELFDAMESGESWVRYAAGLCGEAWAVEFHALVAVAGEVPSYDEIVRNPGNAKVMDTVGGRYSSVDMLASNVKKDDVEAIFGYLGRFPDNDRNEFKAMFANQAIRRNPEIINTKAFDKFMVEFQEMMK